MTIYSIQIRLLQIQIPLEYAKQFYVSPILLDSPTIIQLVTDLLMGR